MSQALITAAGAGFILAIAETVAGVGFLVLRARNSPRFAALIAALILATAGLLVALQSDYPLLCPATMEGLSCQGDASFATHVYLLWTVETAFAFALALAPWRKARRDRQSAAQVAGEGSANGKPSGPPRGGWGPGRLLATAGAVAAVGGVVLLMWDNSGARGCADCSTFHDVMVVARGTVVFGFPTALMTLLVLAIVRLPAHVREMRRSLLL